MKSSPCLVDFEVHIRSKIPPTHQNPHQIFSNVYSRFRYRFPKKTEQFNQKFGLNGIISVKYCHKYWQLDDANLRYCRDKGQHLKSPGGDTVRVRVPSTAPNQYNPNLVFPVGDGFGLFVFFGKFEETHFRNGVIKRPESKPRGPRKKKQI